MSEMKVMEARRHELFTDLSITLSNEMQRLGINKEIATVVSETTCDHICNHWGGQLITIPKDTQYKRHQRNQAIRREFNGNNHAELACKFGLTQRAIYKIVSNQ